LKNPRIKFKPEDRLSRRTKAFINNRQLDFLSNLNRRITGLYREERPGHGSLHERRR
jgi:hypothetical protein